MPGHSTFVFDGACPFCSTCARFIVRYVPTDAEVAAYQLVDLDAVGLSVDQVEKSVQWVSAGGRTSSGPEAITDLMRSSRARFWRGLGWLLSRRPMMAVPRPTKPTDLSRAELDRLARDLDISGRSKMSKGELAKAVASASASSRLVRRRRDLRAAMGT